MSEKINKLCEQMLVMWKMCGSDIYIYGSIHCFLIGCWDVGVAFKSEDGWMQIWKNKKIKNNRIYKIHLENI